MNDICTGKDSTDATHCWHPTGQLLCSMPPQSVHKCCWCGDTKNVSERWSVPVVGHGPHFPKEVI